MPIQKRETFGTMERRPQMSNEEQSIVRLCQCCNELRLRPLEKKDKMQGKSPRASPRGTRHLEETTPIHGGRPHRSQVQRCPAGLGFPQAPQRVSDDFEFTTQTYGVTGKLGRTGRRSRGVTYRSLHHSLASSATGSAYVSGRANAYD